MRWLDRCSQTSTSCQVFEGLDEAALTPSQRHQSLRQQVSIQLQYASAERHKFMRQNSPPLNMRAYDNALALHSEDAANFFSPQARDHASDPQMYHLSPQSRMENTTAPSAESVQAPLQQQSKAMPTRKGAIAFLPSEPSLQDLQSSQPSFSGFHLSPSSSTNAKSASNIARVPSSGAAQLHLSIRVNFSSPVCKPVDQFIDSSFSAILQV